MDDGERPEPISGPVYIAAEAGDAKSSSSGAQGVLNKKGGPAIILPCIWVGLIPSVPQAIQPVTPHLSAGRGPVFARGNFRAR